MKEIVDRAEHELATVYRGHSSFLRWKVSSDSHLPSSLDLVTLGSSGQPDPDKVPTCSYIALRKTQQAAAWRHTISRDDLSAVFWLAATRPNNAAPSSSPPAARQAPALPQDAS